MAQITIEVPDDFTQRLEPFQNQISELFTRYISATLLSKPSESTSQPAAKPSS